MDTDTPQFPPPPPPRRRRTWLWVLLSVALGAVVTVTGITAIAVAGSNAAQHTGKRTGTHHSHPVAPVAAPAPAPSPDGHGTMTCDVSLSASLYGKSHLIADIRYHNTGNVGTVTKVVMKWPQEGYGPLTMTKTVRLSAGASTVLHFHRAVSSEEVDRFQNVQLATDGNPCDFSLDVISTFQ